MRAQSLHWIILIALFAGLALSIFAWQETVNTGLQSVCSVNPLFSCQAVDRSGHNTIQGIPDYLFGIAGFSLMIALEIPLMLTYRRILLDALIIVSVIGVGFAVYFLSVEAFVIGAVCPVCLSTYIANGVALGAALALWRKGRAEPADAAADEKSPSAADKPAA